MLIHYYSKYHEIKIVAVRTAIVSPTTRKHNNSSRIRRFPLLLLQLFTFVFLLLLFNVYYDYPGYNPIDVLFSYHHVNAFRMIAPLFSSTSSSCCHQYNDKAATYMTKEQQQQHNRLFHESLSRSVQQQRHPMSLGMYSSYMYDQKDTKRNMYHYQTSLFMSIINTTIAATNNDENNNNDSLKTVVEISPKKNNNINTTKIDIILSLLTNCFPLFVILSALFGIYIPNALLWVNHGNIITYMLAFVMFGTGVTLEFSDFSDIIKKNFNTIPLGVACQFIIMPFTAYIVGRILLYPIAQTISGVGSGISTSRIGNELFLGLILVGCSPGGTASNLVSLIAKANVALSVLLTSVSTIMAVFMTPFSIKLLLSLLPKTITSIPTVITTKTVITKAVATTTAQTMISPTISVSGLALCIATAKVVLGPALFGMLFKKYTSTKITNTISRFTPFASVLLVSLICGGVVSQNSIMLSTSTTTLLPIIILSVLLLHTIGFIGGYMIPKYIFGYKEQISRTISIEVGMQNSALAIVLAKSIGAHPLACLPGALSATVHSCLGSLLAAIWRLKDNYTANNSNHDGGTNNHIHTIQEYKESNMNDGPEVEFSI